MQYLGLLKIAAPGGDTNRLTKTLKQYHFVLAYGRCPSMGLLLILLFKNNI